MALDDFNRANENPLNPTNWGVPTATAMQVVSNLCAASASSAGAESVWKTLFGPDAYSEIKVTTRPASGQYVILTVRLSNYTDTTTRTGYFIRWQRGADCVIYRFNGNGTDTELARAVGPTFADGDIVRLSAEGSTISVQRNGAAAFLTATDATYGSAGYCGIGITNSTSNIGRLDDFNAASTGLSRTGTGSLGGVGSGVSASTTQEAGRGVAGAAGSGAKQFIGAITYIKTGRGAAALVGAGSMVRISAGATTSKTGFGRVGSTATSRNWKAVQAKGVSIGFGQGSLTDFPVWTRVDGGGG